LIRSQPINKRVRTGSIQDQAISTTTKVVEAIERKDWEGASQLLDYWMEEAKVVYVVYQTWTRGWLEFLTNKGVSASTIESEINRLKRLLAFPDGSEFETESRWETLSANAELLIHRMRALQLTEQQAIQELDALRELWRQHHDRGADFQSGLLTYVAKTFGEDAIGDAYAQVLAPYIQERYAVFDIREHSYDSTLERNIYLTFEAMRGHLVGPERNGDMEVTEDEDKVVVAFDPCGSGNRGQRGDLIEGTGSRSDPPYEFGVTTERHDWAWNELGVCYYCAHCCYALEYWPAKEWGHPLRIVDPPLHPQETSGPQPKKCTWTIYKNLEAIPEEAYKRIGLTKPPDVTN